MFFHFIFIINDRKSGTLGTVPVQGISHGISFLTSEILSLLKHLNISLTCPAQQDVYLIFLAFTILIINYFFSL